jgi:hypothetical protein
MTTIVDYLNETKHASEVIINAIWNDYNRVDRLKKEIKDESNIVRLEYNRALAMQFYAEDPDDVMDGVGRYWDNYFGADKKLFHKNEKLVKLTKMLAVRELSLTTLSGNLLENTKKGISIIYGKPNKWPKGKNVGSQALSFLIHQSRNQSTHIDEAIKNGKFKNSNISHCFKLLKKEIDNIFADFLKRDMAFEIIKMLDWTNYEKFRLDIETIK